MSQASIRTLNYAKPPPGHYWRWSERADAIEWHDGETLALWQEALTVLNSLQPIGIPPFGSVLILIAACRDDAHFIGRMRELIDSRLKDPFGRGIDAPLQDSIFDGLQAIRELPREQRFSLAAKCHLASLVFAASTYRLSRKDTKEVLGDLIALGPRGLGAEIPRYPSRERFLLDLKALEPGLSRHTSKRLESLLLTGLEETDLRPAPLPEPAEDAENPRVLLDRLIATGGECKATAMVAKRAIAMINFPGQVGSPRDLPVGGIADITNRGTIDRLLPGELAWDDLVLAARLVHNEALYFRREIPPLNVATAHTILLDRGLRLWGCGRVFSLGVALGLWHHPDLSGQGESIECVASTGRDFEYLELDTPAKIAAALEPLVPAAGPDAFLESWWAAAQIVDDPALPEVSLITERHHIEAAGTRTLLGRIAEWIHGRGGQFRVIALGRGGGLEVQSWTPGGNRTLFRGEMDLDEILTPPQLPPPDLEAAPPPQQLILFKEDNPLLEISPIYGLPLLPFLFPLLPRANAFLPHDGGEGGMGVSTARLLAVWPVNGRGGRFVAEVPGASHWIGRDESGDAFVICSAGKVGDPVRVFWIKDGKPEEIEIARSAHSYPRHAAISGGAVVLAYSDRAEAFSLKSGQRLTTSLLSHFPPQPILEFDGEAIHIYDKGKDAASPTEGWYATDKRRLRLPGSKAEPWPTMLDPEAACFRRGCLQISCSKQLYEFDPQAMIWKETKSNKAPLVPFHPCEKTLPDGRPIQIAGPSVSPQAVWLDPRGFICVGRIPERPAQGWCIMLSAPATSAWNAKSGLCSNDERLRMPGPQADNLAAISELRSFIKQASSQAQ